MKRPIQAVIFGTALALSAICLTAPARADDMRDEMKEHPRIVKAIHELEKAIKYMEAAPHDFGGAKQEAIEQSRHAVESLRRALRYRARHDHHEDHDEHR